MPASFSTCVTPATAETMVRVPLFPPHEEDEAVHAAQAAFPAWSCTLLVQRIQYLFKLKRLQDYRAVFDRPDIEAVAICSTPDTHVRFIEEAAQAGKHIFCEKPIANDLASIDRALGAVERAGVKLQIGSNRRFDANYRRVYQALALATGDQANVVAVCDLIAERAEALAKKYHNPRMFTDYKELLANGLCEAVVVARAR